MTLTYNPSSNNLLEIFIICFTMGITLTISIIILLVTSSLSNKYIWLVIYSLLLHGFFILEFINSSLYQYNSVTSKSFLIYGNKGNKQFWYLQLLTIWEYLLLRLGKLNVIVKYFPNIGNWSWSWSWSWWWWTILQIFGLLISLLGLFIRHLAMKTCGLSFNHYLITPSPNHSKNQYENKLITHGIYKYVRHPSYLGFWLYCIGIQLMLLNIGNLTLTIYILNWFFRIRIEYEENQLINKYGDKYINYQQTTKQKILIPLI